MAVRGGHGRASGDGFLAECASLFPLQLALAALLGGGLGEEVGWRGHMAATLAPRTGELRAAGLVGAAWFAWHLPAYVLTDKGDSDPILPFVIICLAASVVLARVYFHSGRVLWLPILLHGSLNATAYTLEGIRPALLASEGFQPWNDYLVAACWCVLAALSPWICPASRDRGVDAA